MVQLVVGCVILIRIDLLSFLLTDVDRSDVIGQLTQILGNTNDYSFLLNPSCLRARST